MKIAPILFSTPMVIEIKEERKTCTRRVITQQPPDGYTILRRCPADEEFFWIRHTEDEEILWFPDREKGLHPLYSPGDILWVRETWCVYVDSHVADSKYAYKADATPLSEEIRQTYIKAGFPYQWKPSIFMPKEAARFFLHVRSVRAERVQEITESDARAEGVIGNDAVKVTSYIYWFQQLWDRLNKKRGFGWDSNPWVWVYQFELVDKPDDWTSGESH